MQKLFQNRFEWFHQKRGGLLFGQSLEEQAIADIEEIGLFLQQFNLLNEDSFEMEKDTADRDKLNKLNSLPIEDISLALKQTLIEEPTQVNDKRMLQSNTKNRLVKNKDTRRQCLKEPKSNRRKETDKNKVQSKQTQIDRIQKTNCKTLNQLYREKQPLYQKGIKQQKLLKSKQQARKKQIELEEQKLFIGVSHINTCALKKQQLNFFERLKKNQQKREINKIKCLKDSMRDCSFKPKTNRHELGTTVSISEFSPDFNVVSESMLKIGEVEMDSLFQYRKSDSNF